MKDTEKKCGNCKYFRPGRNIYEEFCVHPEMMIACDENNTEYCCVLWEERIQGKSKRKKTVPNPKYRGGPQ
jgi:hypothetical protein